MDSGIDLIKDALTRKYVDFNGRASRKEYWMFQLFAWLAFLLWFILYFGYVTLSDSDVESTTTGIELFFWFILWCMLMALGLPTIALAVRRMHDIDRDGAWVILAYVPVLNMVYLVFTLSRGTAGPNRFGVDPKTKSVSKRGEKSLPIAEKVKPNRRRRRV